MTLKLYLVRETERARQFEKPGKGRLWVPRSVCRRTLKFAPEAGKPRLTEVEIEDWWLDKNPWPAQEQKELL
jgi:hypothetical protein